MRVAGKSSPRTRVLIPAAGSARGALTRKRENSSCRAHLLLLRSAATPPACPQGPGRRKDPSRVRCSPGSREGAARLQGGHRGLGGHRRSGGPWLRPGDRARAAGAAAAAAAAVATKAPRRATAWRGRPDPGRNRSPGAGTGPRPRRHLPARPRPAARRARGHLPPPPDPPPPPLPLPPPPPQPQPSAGSSPLAVPSPPSLGLSAQPASPVAPSQSPASTPRGRGRPRRWGPRGPAPPPAPLFAAWLAGLSAAPIPFSCFLLRPFRALAVHDPPTPPLLPTFSLSFASFLPNSSP